MDTTSGGFALTHEFLTQPPIHIPDLNGGSYKTELVIVRSPEYTEKYIWWHADDPREDFHNHPWTPDFTSEILSGGYEQEAIWWNGFLGKVQREISVFRAGDFNTVPRDVYHRVYNVQPNTVTHLKCGRTVDSAQWDYMNKSNGQTFPIPDTDFRNRLLNLNPHLRSA